MSRSKIPQYYNEQEDIKNKRASAFVVDFFLSFVMSVFFSFIFYRYDIVSKAKIETVASLMMNAGIVLKDVFSIGKRGAGIALVNESGQKAKWYQKIFRNIFIGPFMAIDFILIMSNQPRLGDRIFKTKVVLKEKRK